MLNAELTWEPSRKFPYLLGVVILITVKSPKSLFAIFAILFRLEFGKPGTSASRDTLWNFRASDYLGETVQIAEELSIGESLEAWFPRWRTFQQTSFHPELLPRCPRRPFVWRMSCHRKVPGVVLP